jgi:hypothetical protein
MDEVQLTEKQQAKLNLSNSIIFKSIRIRLILTIVITILLLTLLKLFIIKQKVTTKVYTFLSIIITLIIYFVSFRYFIKHTPFNRIFMQEVKYLKPKDDMYIQINLSGVPNIKSDPDYYSKIFNPEFNKFNLNANLITHINLLLEISVDNEFRDIDSINKNRANLKPDVVNRLDVIMQMIEQYKLNKTLINQFIINQETYLNSLTSLQREIIFSYQNAITYPVFTKFLNKNKYLINTDSSINEYPHFEFVYNEDPSIFESNDVRIIMNNIAKQLNDIIVKAPPTPVDLHVYRGTKDPYFLSQLSKEGDDYYFTNKSVMSTTFNFGIMSAPTISTQYLSNNCCISIINIPKGTVGLYLDNYNDVGRELAEFLLPIGSKLKLVGYTKNYKFGRDTFEWNYIPPDSTEYVELYKY